MPVATERIAARAEITPFLTGAEHLLAEMERFSLMVHADILRLRVANQLTENQFRGLYVSDEQIDALLHVAAREQSSQNEADSALTTLRAISDRVIECEHSLAARSAASRAAEVVLPLERLSGIYSLSKTERDALLLALAPELDARFETLYSYAQNDVTRKRPTVGLILRLLRTNPAAQLGLRALFSPSGTLLQVPLLRFSEEAPEREAALLSRAVKPEERIVDFLLEHDGIDARLRPFTTYIQPARHLASLYFSGDFAAEIKQAADVSRSCQGGLLFFHGPAGAGKRAVAKALSAESGRSLVVADLRQANAAGAATPATLGLLRREARLRAANLLLTHAEIWLNEEGSQRQPPQPAWESLLDSSGGQFGSEIPIGGALNEPTATDSMANDSTEHGSAEHDSAKHDSTDSTENDSTANAALVFVSSESQLPVAQSAPSCPWTEFEFPIPDFPCRSKLWQEAIAAAGAGQQPAMAAALANQFVLTGGQINAACRTARTHAQLRGRNASTLTSADFQAAARAQSNQNLRRRAQKVATTHGWPDLVLPPRTLQQLREVCAAEKYRSFIFAEWGFDRRLMQGKGLNILFCGVSGTGKTMSAGIAARELGLDLYKIDLSTVISKYIGETEKHLSEIFREAQSSNAILFFDEADAIFGKRSEVKDAHDRYANVEVAYLLQKMEDYEGVVILATNFRKNIDDAFTRRIQYIVEFPFPEPKYRERIWRGLIPASAPLSDDVDFGFLARQFELAGGSIRNAAMVAAFLAAEEGAQIRMEHFVLATARELQKLGKLPSRSDFKEYYDLTRDRI
jgi:SpoVK/Ycf46/Vps4 family AAA+-type ATPase